MASIRCKISGCDLDACGICRRCRSDAAAKHEWKEAQRRRPCYKREECERCDEEREQPQHDWGPSPAGLKCSRCGLQI